MDNVFSEEFYDFENSLNFFEQNFRINFEELKEYCHFDDECIICLDSLLKIDLPTNQQMKNVSKLRCNHIFHTKCLRELLFYDTKCPICRKIINT